MPRPSIPSPLRAPLRASGLAVSTLARLGAVTAHQALVPHADRDAVFDRHMRSWCHALLSMFGVRVEVTPSPPSKPAGSRLVVANHRSPADIIVLLSLFGGQFLSTAGVASWPILGAAARKAGTIFVERERGSSRASAIRTMRRRLKEGATMLVFPEGTTFAGDEVRPFMLGALSAAKGLEVELVPVGLAYDPGAEWVDEPFAAYLKRIASRPNATVAVRIGTPTRPGKGEDTAALSQRLRTEIQGLVTAARSDHDRAARLS